MTKPHLYVFAGANGSGKSTVIDFYLKNNLCPQEYICPDQLVPADKKEDVGEYILAMNEAEKRRIDKIALKEPFTFETVLSTERNLLLLQKAKSRGYEVRCVYVLTCDENINVARVKARIVAGGHSVPANKIRARYRRALSLLPLLVEICDVIYVYDNSISPVLIFNKEHNFSEIYPNSLWSEPALKNLLGI